MIIFNLKHALQVWDKVDILAELKREVALMTSPTG